MCVYMCVCICVCMCVCVCMLLYKGRLNFSFLILICLFNFAQPPFHAKPRVKQFEYQQFLQHKKFQCSTRHAVCNGYCHFSSSAATYVPKHTGASAEIPKLLACCWHRRASFLFLLVQQNWAEWHGVNAFLTIAWKTTVLNPRQNIDLFWFFVVLLKTFSSISRHSTINRSKPLRQISSQTYTERPRLS
jgi:hypothetical protein